MNRFANFTPPTSFESKSILGMYWTGYKFECRHRKNSKLPRSLKCDLRSRWSSWVTSPLVRPQSSPDLYTTLSKKTSKYQHTYLGNHWGWFHGQKCVPEQSHPPHAALGHRRTIKIPIPNPKLPQRCYDSDNRVRLDEYPHTIIRDLMSLEHLNEWIDLYQNNKRERTVVLVVGNKSDLEEERVVPREDAERRV